MRCMSSMNSCGRWATGGPSQHPRDTAVNQGLVHSGKVPRHLRRRRASTSLTVSPHRRVQPQVGHAKLSLMWSARIICRYACHISSCIRSLLSDVNSCFLISPQKTGRWMSNYIVIRCQVSSLKKAQDCHTMTTTRRAMVPESRGTIFDSACQVTYVFQSETPLGLSLAEL